MKNFPLQADIPIVISFLYTFISVNIYGWGIYHDKRFIAFIIVLSILYGLSHFVGIFAKPLWENRIKIVLLVGFITVSVFAATIHVIYLRHMTSVTGFVNDSALQVEIAGRFLLLGKNPYTETYEHTDLAQWKYKDEAGNTVNQALYHTIYPPFLLVASAAGYRIFSQLFGFFDIRILYLTAYFFVLLLCFLRFKFSSASIYFLVFIGVNPLFINSFIPGSNDIVFIAFILWSAFLLEKQKYIPSGILFGLSLATKQSAWFAIPFFLYYVWQKEGKNTFLRFSSASLVSSLLFYIPFMIWNLSDLFSDLVLFANGSLVTSYPITGVGLGMLLFSLGIIPSIYSYYPFWVWQVVVGFPALSFFLRALKLNMNIGYLLFGYSVFLSINGFFNRFLTERHLAVFIALFGISFAWSLTSKNTTKTKR